MDDIDRLLTIIENRTRRRILEMITEAPSYPLQISKELGVSQQAIMKNLALMEETEVEFTPGLNILTGETGAGKSIIIDGINLLLGAKTEKELVRTGASAAMVSGLFGDFSENTVHFYKISVGALKKRWDYDIVNMIKISIIYAYFLFVLVKL